MIIFVNTFFKFVEKINFGVEFFNIAMYTIKKGGSMGSSIKIKMLLAAREMTLKDLADKLEPKTSVQNISQKMKRDNFSEKELQAIAEILNCDYDVIFIMRDTGKQI